MTRKYTASHEINICNHNALDNIFTKVSVNIQYLWFTMYVNMYNFSTTDGVV